MKAGRVDADMAETGKARGGGMGWKHARGTNKTDESEEGQWNINTWGAEREGFRARNAQISRFRFEAQRLDIRK